MQPQFVVGVGRYVMELVNRDQPVVEGLDPKLIDRKPEGSMGADQHLVSASQKACTEFTLPPLSSPGALQRFHFGVTIQSAQNPCLVSCSSAKLEPIDFSGTTMIAWRTPWFWSLSSAMNISARLFPDAGGDLINRYCSPRFS